MPDESHTPDENNAADRGPGAAATEYSVCQDDAVCFSAGRKGALFGAGCIHAYLASDRKPPTVAAGISVGALSAAVMERSYRDLRRSRSETARWSWFRRYMAFLLDRPYDVIWQAIPDPSDMLADLPPVRDPDLPVNEHGETIEAAKERDVFARRKLYIVAKLGSWLARVPVRMSSVAWLAVRYVRMQERYPRNQLLRVWNFVCLQGNLLAALWGLLRHTSFRPFWIQEWQFRYADRQCGSRFALRPLFGWMPWLVSISYWLATLSLGLWTTLRAALEWRRHEHFHVWHLFEHVLMFLIFVLAPAIPVWIAWILRRARPQKRGNLIRNIADSVLGSLDIRQSLLSDFPLLLKLYRLFEEPDHHTPTMQDCEFPVLLVAAPLQVLPSHNGFGIDSPNQLWPKVNVNRKQSSTLPIVRALRACLAVTPWFAPLVVQRETVRNRDGKPEVRDERSIWIRRPRKHRHADDALERLDLVDGAAVRHNPLPALFGFLRENPQLAKRLRGDVPRVHLVYDVPIRWRPEPPEMLESADALEPDLPNIVATGFAGMQLAHRRDSRYEVLRTNELSELEAALQAATGHATTPAVQTIKVDEIAPEDELKVANQLKPTQTEVLQHVAAGCRQTLSVLYRTEIDGERNCWDFLTKRARLRHWDETPSPGLPGLAEVCRHCTRKLTGPSLPPAGLLDESFRAGTGELARKFPRLTGELPRIVFVASGGVFRGSFHIGMLGAMLALNIKPDLIVGSSVGTLMGAALGSIFNAKAKAANPRDGEAAARAQLHKMVELFVRVDETIALTKRFKGAAKNLGVRGRSSSLRLAPNELRKMVQRGSREDPGVAATGAPPALIDAISDLFLIPYRKTADIAASFIAGHFAEAIHEFWQQISTETIDRLGIHDAVLGASLIEKEMRQLLADDIPAPGDTEAALQPFLTHSEIAFFGTTVNLATESITTLGSELNRPSFDMMEALLASSAFPAAFAPRRASTLYPGLGRRDIFYGDGGMFDNLPAVSAIQVLREVQKDRLRTSVGNGLWREELARRHREPDLFIVGSLNTRQPDGIKDKDGKVIAYDSILRSWTRAQCLADNEKIYGLERVSEMMDRQLSQVEAPEKIDDARRALDKQIDPPKQSEREALLNGVVNAAILAVYPRDAEHLNGTFQFCTSLGFDKNRLRRSIANGCFEMLSEIYAKQGGAAAHPPLVKRAVIANHLPVLEVRSAGAASGACPYFKSNGAEVHCPFHGSETSNTIHAACIADETHRAIAAKL